MLKRVLFLFALALLLSVGAELGVGFSHSLVIGLNPFLGTMTEIVLILLGVLAGIMLGKFLSRRFKEMGLFTPAALFLMGSFFFLTIWFIDSIILNNHPPDMQLRDAFYARQFPYWRSLPFYMYLMAGIAVVYHFYPAVVGNPVDRRLAFFHFLLTLITAFVISQPARYAGGLAGMPRRYIDYGDIHLYGQLIGPNRVVVRMVVLLLAAQVLFLFNLIYSADLRRND